MKNYAVYYKEWEREDSYWIKSKIRGNPFKDPEAAENIILGNTGCWEKYTTKKGKVRYKMVGRDPKTYLECKIEEIDVPDEKLAEKEETKKPIIRTCENGHSCAGSWVSCQKSSFTWECDLCLQNGVNYEGHPGDARVGLSQKESDEYAADRKAYKDKKESNNSKNPKLSMFKQIKEFMDGGKKSAEAQAVPIPEAPKKKLVKILQDGKFIGEAYIREDEEKKESATLKRSPYFMSNNLDWRNGDPVLTELRKDISEEFATNPEKYGFYASKEETAKRNAQMREELSQDTPVPEDRKKKLVNVLFLYAVHSFPCHPDNPLRRSWHWGDDSYSTFTIKTYAEAQTILLDQIKNEYQIRGNDETGYQILKIVDADEQKILENHTLVFL